MDQILDENKESVCQAELREDYFKGLTKARRVSLATHHPNIHKNLSGFKTMNLPRSNRQLSGMGRQSFEFSSLNKNSRMTFREDEDFRRIREDFAELRQKFSEDTISQRMYDFKVSFGRYSVGYFEDESGKNGIKNDQVFVLRIDNLSLC